MKEKQENDSRVEKRKNILIICFYGFWLLAIVYVGLIREEPKAKIVKPQTLNVQK